MQTDVLIFTSDESYNIGDWPLPMVPICHWLEAQGHSGLRAVNPFTYEPLGRMMSDVYWGTFESLEVEAFLHCVESAGWRTRAPFMLLIKSGESQSPFTIYCFNEEKRLYPIDVKRT